MAAPRESDNSAHHPAARTAEQGAHVVEAMFPRLQELLETGQSLVRIEGAAFRAARFREVPESF
tara:strand:- start:684 stop:875 length:192 start_codon:yes stop_codon:yes gene_type:complete